MLAKICYGLYILKKIFSFVWGSAWGNLWLQLSGVETAGLVRCFGIPHIVLHPQGKMVFGKHVELRSAGCSNIAGEAQPVYLAVTKTGCLSLGDGVGITASTICSNCSIEIGKKVLIGTNCRIYDCDFHDINLEKRLNRGKGKSAPVKIEDGVWLAANVTVLKGVTIGAGSVISCGSVVFHDIPAGVLAGGIPATVIRKLD